MLDLDHYQAIIFDMDGTLLDTMPSHLEAWSKTTAHFNLPFDQAWIHSMGGMPSAKIAAVMLEAANIEGIPTEIAAFKMKTFNDNPTSADPIAHTLKVMKKYAGIKPMAIGTGSMRDTAERLLRHANLYEEFDYVVSSNDVEQHKPNPDTFLLASKLMSTEPNNCIVFEDTQLGLQAAHAGGMDCYLVTSQGFEFHPVS
ncbi:beta-phosphoglucomutase family hydrolase [Vibrio sp. E150_011]